MNPNEFGKKLGIGVRVAGRIAQQRAQDRTSNPDRTPNQVPSQPNNPASMPSSVPKYAAKARDIRKKAPGMTRAAGRGIGGFLRPFTRVGGILWLEVTGFFFGLFGTYFATDIWKARASYAHGPEHTRFVVAVIATAIFGYLCVSSFWRARRK
ncbi:hypothetical protein [Acidicapsa ligni]|uniref:hypothetical protein n=1 Tax=Acidicapsa ligni TaxID=542300 RepID=UPI0021DFCECB|nr:hypothetical protein [Acidicapsa ligni]